LYAPPRALWFDKNGALLLHSGSEGVCQILRLNGTTMIAEIISIGQELVLGEITDTNAAFISSRLAPLGIDVRYHSCLGDFAQDLAGVLKIAFQRANVIVITGGLGPTADDVTRQVIAEFCEAPLQLHEESLRRIEALFRSRHLTMSPNNQIQAMIPAHAQVIPNERGTAAGFCLNHKGVEIMALPGVPSEMKGMFEGWVYPHLQERTGNKSTIVTKLLNCFGTGESIIGQKIHHLMDTRRNPYVGTMVHGGVVSVRIIGKASTQEEAQPLIAATESEIRGLLGNIIFGENEEGLEHAVAAQLARVNMTLSVAESCTGGLIAHKLTNVPGISRYFLEGIVAYSNEAKVEILNVPKEMIAKHGAVSAQVAEAMAKGVQTRSDSNFAIGITGIAGPTGATPTKPVGLVYIAVAIPGDIQTQEFRFGGTREDIKERAAKAALNMLRLRITDVAANINPYQ
jgi:nicotinamide-nucleotide amidase